MEGTPFDASAVSAFEFEDSEWIGTCLHAAFATCMIDIDPSALVGTGNAAGTGAAIISLDQTQVRIRRSLFRDNIAYLSGGAISYQGVSPSSLLNVASSIFERNVVRPLSSAKGVDITVLVNTGGVGLGTANGGEDESKYIAPVWRVDDEVVYGISWELCQGALQHAAADARLAASWPSSLRCANMTYTGPRSSYSHILHLAEGPHTLYAGVVSMSQQRSRGWLGGSIEIANVAGPFFPNPTDK